MALIAAIIYHYGVNVPYGDEWWIITLLGKWDSHELTFADFYGAHNGHRILIPRLIYLALTKLGHGNLRVEMFFSLSLCVVTSAGFYLLLQRTMSGSATKRIALWALINLFLFSPIQAENWLWGFQLQIFLSNLCLIGAIVCITSPSSLPLRFSAAAAFGLAGTFSFGNGLLIWPAVLLVLVCRREKIAAMVAWIALAGLALLAYLPGYQALEPSAAATRWFDYLLYFAGFLGASLARIPNRAPLVLPVILGSILVAGYLWSAPRLLRQRNALRNAAPWLALGAYAMASALMASAARTRFGAEHALDSRYTTVSLLLVISLIGLVSSQVTQDRPAKGNLLAGFAVGSLLVLYAINAPFELRYLRLHHAFRERGKGALEFSSVLDLEQMCRANLLIRQGPDALVECLTVLDRLELLDPPRRKTLALDDAEGRPKRITDEFGIFESVAFESADVLVASGWSYLPGEAAAPAGILLAYRSGEAWKAFALSEVTMRRPELTAKYKNSSYLETGWKFTFPRSLLPSGAQEISAWALDAEQGQTYRLPGSFTLQH
jgi:hypothetical protein